MKTPWCDATTSIIKTGCTHHRPYLRDANDTVAVADLVRRFSRGLGRSKRHDHAATENIRNLAFRTVHVRGWLPFVAS